MAAPSAADLAATVRERIVPGWAWKEGTEREYASDANVALDALLARITELEAEIKRQREGSE